MSNKIISIIEKKKIGIDCTEEESAEIKGYLREYKFPNEQCIVSEIQYLFPIEYGEWLDEDSPFAPNEGKRGTQRSPFGL